MRPVDFKDEFYSRNPLSSNKDNHKMSFNDWLKVNCQPTRNNNLFIKNKKLQTRIELISMYEKE